MNALPQYQLRDAERQARLEAFAACRDITNLEREISLLREMLERAAQQDKARLCNDIVSTLVRASATLESARLKAKELLSRDEVFHVMGTLAHIVHEEIVLLNLPNDTRDELTDRIVERIRSQANNEALLLEVEPNDEKHS